MLALDRAQRGSVQFLTFMSQYIVSQPRPAGKQEVYLQIGIGSVDRQSTNKADLNLLAIELIVLCTVIFERLFIPLAYEMMMRKGNSSLGEYLVTTVMEPLSTRDE